MTTKDVRVYPGVPPASVFGSASGSPIVINTVTGSLYYLRGDVVTLIPVLDILDIPIAVVSTGFDYTIPDGKNGVIFKPAGLLLTGTVRMPVNPAANQRLTISSTQVITTFTVSPNTGQAILGTPVTLALGGSFCMFFNPADSTWYPVG